MPVYWINGKRYESAQELSPQDLEVMKSAAPSQEKGLLGRAWDTVFTTPEPVRRGLRTVGESIASLTPNKPMQSPFQEGLRLLPSFIGGAIGGVGQIGTEQETQGLSGIINPGDLALTALGMGEVGAAAKGMKTAAKYLGQARKLTSYPVVAHGAGNVLHKESTIPERLMGVAEMAGGYAGVKAPVATAKPKGKAKITNEEVTWDPTEQELPFNTVEPPQPELPYYPTARPETRLTPDIPEATSQRLPFGTAEPTQSGLPFDVIPPSLPEQSNLPLGPPVRVGMRQILPFKPSPTPETRTMPVTSLGDQPLNQVDINTELARARDLEMRPPLSFESGQNKRTNNELMELMRTLTPEEIRALDSVDDLGQPINPVSRPPATLAEGPISPEQQATYDAFLKETETPPRRPVTPDAEVKVITEVDGTNRVWINGEEYTGNFGPGGPTDIEIRQLRNQIKDPDSYRRLEELKAQQAGTQLESITPLPPKPMPESTTTLKRRPVDEQGQPIEVKEWTPEELEIRKKAIASDWYTARKQARELGINDKKYPKLSDLKKAIVDTVTRLAKEESGGVQFGPDIKGTGPTTPKGTEPPPPPMGPLTNVEREEGWRKYYNVARGSLSVDLPYLTSAAFRQGLPWIGTKYWIQAWKKQAQAYGSLEAFKMQNRELQKDLLFMPQPKFRGQGNIPIHEWTGSAQINKGDWESPASKMGLELTDVGETPSKREEIIKSVLIEKVPGYGTHHVAGSNRAYTAFLNHIRANAFRDLVIQTGAWDGRQFTDEVMARAIAEFVNTTTGRGALKLKLGNKELSAEKYSQGLTDLFFSPRLQASRIQMLNPFTYMMAPKPLRKEYTKRMLSAIGAWWTMASLLELAGGEVSKDPNSSDFGKIRFGDTRIDPGGGFQQYLVAMSRARAQSMSFPGIEPTESGFGPLDLATGLLGTGGGGITSPTTQKFTPFGQGYKPETWGSTSQRFVASKLHPIARLAYDFYYASPQQPFHTGDRMLQLFIPIMVQDLVEAGSENPLFLAGIAGMGSIGMGASTYEGGPTQPTFIPEEYDLVFKK